MACKFVGTFLIDRPICAVCNRPVDFIQNSYSYEKRGYEFVVRCHGKEERFLLTDIFLSQAEGIPEVGRAFEQEQSGRVQQVCDRYMVERGLLTFEQFKEKHL